MPDYKLNYKSNVVDVHIVTATVSETPQLSEEVSILNLCNRPVTITNRRGLTVTVPEGRTTEWVSNYNSPISYYSNADKPEGVYVTYKTRMGQASLSSFEMYLRTAGDDVKNHAIYSGFKEALKDRIEKINSGKLSPSRNQKGNIPGRYNPSADYVRPTTDLEYETTFFISEKDIMKDGNLYDSTTDLSFSIHSTTNAPDHKYSLLDEDKQLLEQANTYFKESNSYEHYIYVSNTLNKELYRKCGKNISVIHSIKNTSMKNGVYIAYKYYDEHDESQPFKTKHVFVSSTDTETLASYGLFETMASAKSEGTFKTKEELYVYEDKKKEKAEKTWHDVLKNLTKILSYVATIGGIIGTVIYNVMKLKAAATGK